MIFETNIRAEIVIRHLSILPGMSIEKALTLLDALDKQNVPKAVSLIQHLIQLKTLPEPENPTNSKHRNVINFIANFLGSFVLPFIDIEMTLENQLVSLIKFAHLAAFLQVQHGSSCLTGALYSDTQAVVKNIIFTIARLKLISPELEFFILLEGTERLEMLFGDCRTQDHARNFDIEQLAGKLAVASLINAAFEKNPDLDRGHRRLNLKDALGVDHINPRSWEGDCRVGSVNLKFVWETGRDAANQALESSFGPSARCNFFAMFSGANCDLLRPGGKYIGIKETADDLRSEQENYDLTTDLASIFPGLPTVPATVTTVDVTGEMTTPSSQAFSDDEFADELSGLNLENFLPDSYLPDTMEMELNMRDPVDGVVPSFSKTIEVEGKSYLKGSLVAGLIPNRSKKVTMRTLRVQGIALEDLRPKSKFEDLAETLDDDDELCMKSTDLGGFLARTGDNISLCIMEVAGFHEKNKPIKTVATIADLIDTEKSIKVTGQVLELIEHTSDIWQWTGKYLSLDISSKSDQMTKTQFVAEIPSVLIQNITQRRISKGSNGNWTWHIKPTYLQEVLEVLWESLSPDNNEIMTNIQLLPKLFNPEAFPYRTTNSMSQYSSSC